MRRLVAVLVALVAGCAAAPPPDDAPAGAAEGRFAAPVVLPGARGGPEPTVDVAPDGTIYVAAQDPLGEGPRVWVSRDGGASWRERRPTREGGGELSMAAGPAGEVYVTQLGTRGNIVSVSRDRGETWTTAPLGAVTQYFDRQWAAVDAAGGAYLLARDFGRATASVARSDDRGISWVPRGAAWSDADEPGTANGNLVAADGRLHLAYLCRDSRAVCAATSADRGESWTQRVVANPGVATDHVYPSIAAGGGRVLVAWSDAGAGRLGAWVVASDDGGRTWGEPALASEPDESAILPWVAADATRAWVVYAATPLALTSPDGAEAERASWTARARALDGAGAPSGTAVDLTDGPVHAGVVSRPVGRPQGGAHDRNLGDFFTSDLDRDGRLHVAVSRDSGTPGSTRALWIVESPPSG